MLVCLSRKKVNRAHASSTPWTTGFSKVQWNGVGPACWGKTGETFERREKTRTLICSVYVWRHISFDETTHTSDTFVTVKISFLMRSEKDILSQ